MRIRVICLFFYRHIRMHFWDSVQSINSAMRTQIERSVRFDWYKPRSNRFGNLFVYNLKTNLLFIHLFVLAKF